jgi:23S rRNA (guanosine2251-2'-O)-methyltransferase
MNTSDRGTPVNKGYAQKKAFFDSLLTIYGRKPVLEVLEDRDIPIHCVHLADSNKPGGIIADIENLARRRGIAIRYHDKLALSRISRNSREDQGVAADLQLPRYQRLDTFLESWQPTTRARIIALDCITNPQNIGMLIRSAAAGGVDAVLIPEKGCAPLSPLVIKASAGTLFKCPIVRCGDLAEGLAQLQKRQVRVCVLSSHAATSLFELDNDRASVFVLGNETVGVSAAISELADVRVFIPMASGVESLNVAVTGALLAYLS